MTRLRRFVAVVLVAFIVSGCATEGTPYRPNRYHVWCYTQYGTRILSRIVVRRLQGPDWLPQWLHARFWADEETGQDIRLPDDKSAACVWLGLPDAE